MADLPHTPSTSPAGEAAHVVRGAALAPPLAPPPRPVPRLLALHVLLRSTLASAGWWIAAIAGVVVMVTLPRVDRGGELYDRRASATLIAVERTQGQPRKEVPHYELRYEFRDASGTLQRGASWRRTHTPGAVGDRVEVEYVAAAPARSRVVGARASRIPAELAWTAVVASVVGLGLAGGGLARGRRRLRLLRAGVEVGARLVARQAVLDLWSKLTFEFRTEPGATGATHRVTVSTDGPERYEAEAEARALVDLADPTRLLLLAELPEGARIDEGGALVPPPGRARAVLRLPVVTALAWIFTWLQMA